MFVRTDLSIPLKSRFSQPLSQVIVLNVSLNFFVPSLRSSLSSSRTNTLLTFNRTALSLYFIAVGSRTNTLLTFTLYLTDYLYPFQAFGHYHKCCFCFLLAHHRIKLPMTENFFIFGFFLAFFYAFSLLLQALRCWRIFILYYLILNKLYQLEISP